MLLICAINKHAKYIFEFALGDKGGRQGGKKQTNTERQIRKKGEFGD